MNCPKCNAPNPNDALFCSECGLRLDEIAQQPNVPVYGQPAIPDPPPAVDPAAPPSYQNYAPGYYAPAASPLAGDPSKNWAAVTSLIMGILAIVCCFAYVGVILAPLAIIFGVIGLKSQKRGLAIAGLICGGVGVILTIYIIISVAAVLRNGDFQDLLNQYESMLDSF